MTIEELLKYSFVITINQKRFENFCTIFKQNNLPIPQKFRGNTLFNSIGHFSPFLSILKKRKYSNITLKSISGASSHISIIHIAKQMNLPYVCIFEDDAYPCIGINWKLQKYINEIPNDSDCIILGRYRIKDERYNNLFNVVSKDPTNFSGCHAYVIFNGAYDKYIDIVNTVEFIPDHSIVMLDHVYSTSENLFIQYNFEKSMNYEKGYLWSGKTEEQILKQFPRIETYNIHQ